MLFQNRCIGTHKWMNTILDCDWVFYRLIFMFDDFPGNKELFFDKNVHLIKDVSSIIKIVVLTLLFNIWLYILTLGEKQRLCFFSLKLHRKVLKRKRKRNGGNSGSYQLVSCISILLFFIQSIRSRKKVLIKKCWFLRVI